MKPKKNKKKKEGKGWYYDSLDAMDNKMYRFGMMATHFIVGSISIIVYFISSYFTITSGMIKELKIVLVGFWTWTFLWNIGIKNIKRWHSLYKIKLKVEGIKILEKI